jgi:hypothetical protein
MGSNPAIQSSAALIRMIAAAEQFKLTGIIPAN